MTLIGILFRSTDWNKLSYGVRCQYIWISLILLKTSVEKIKGKKVVKKYHIHIYFYFVRAEFCTPRSVPHAQENRKWWQEPETCKQAVLRSPSCYPWAVHHCAWGHEKCNTTRSKWLYFWRSRVVLCLRPACAYTISIKFYLAMYQMGTLVYKNQPCVVFLYAGGNKLKIIHPACSGRLSFAPGKPVAADHRLCRREISVSWAKCSLVGTGSISIRSNENVWSWFKGIKWLMAI